MAERPNVNLTLWNVLAIVTLGLTSKNNDFGFNSFQNLNALGSKLDIHVKKVKVNLGSSFEQTCLAPHFQCYIPSPKVIGLLVLEEKVFEGFTIYGHGGHLGHVTRTI